MDLPVTHFDTLRQRNRALFKFLEKDLEHRSSDPSVKTGTQRPPHPDAFEEMYWSMFLDQAVSRRLPSIATEAGKAITERHMRSEYRAVRAFIEAGSKTFYFSEGVTEGLCYTKLNMPCDLFRLPFPAAMFVYDSSVASEALSLISEQPANEGSVITVYVREETVKETGLRVLRLSITEMRGEEGLFSVLRNLALKSEWTLEQALKTDWSVPGMMPEGREALPGGAFSRRDDGTFDRTDETDEEHELEKFHNELLFIRLVVNSALYVTSRDAELAERISSRKHPAVGSGLVGKATKQVDGFAEAPVVFVGVGESVNPVPIIIEPGKQHQPGEPMTKALRYKVRFMVAGFWRRRPNSEETSPKDVWVTPHARGPEIGTMINNPYVVR